MAKQHHNECYFTKIKFVMKIFFKPIMTSALLSDDQKMPTLDSFWYMTSHIFSQDHNDSPLLLSLLLTMIIEVNNKWLIMFLL